MKTLCVCHSRTGITKTIAETVAEETEAELLFISDGEAYEGFFGYIRAAVVGLRKSLPTLAPYCTAQPMESYDRIVVLCPVWCEDVSPVARKFLLENREIISGEVSICLTHMSPIPYTQKIDKLFAAFGKKPKATLSVQTRKYDFSGDVASFIEKIKEN